MRSPDEWPWTGLLPHHFDDALRHLAATGLVSHYEAIDALKHRGKIVHHEPQDGSRR